MSICDNCKNVKFIKTNDNIVKCISFNKIIKKKKNNCTRSIIDENKINEGSYIYYSNFSEPRTVTIYKETDNILRIRLKNGYIGIKIKDLPIGTMLIKNKWI